MTNFLYPVCFVLIVRSDHFPGYDAEPIQGGYHDRGNEVIWQASYQKKGCNGVWRNVCGGSIIGSEYIVTAAHCFVRFSEDKETQVWDRRRREKSRIVIGTNDLNSSTNAGVEMEIYKVIIPKTYTRLGGKLLVADIAVIKLRGRIDLSINREKYGLIELFDPKNESERSKYDDQEGFVAGFGAIKVAFGPDGKKTHVLDGLRNILPVHLTSYNCPKIRGLRCVRYVKSEEEPKGMCCGDSGGPLYYRNDNTFELVGVISGGPQNCDIRKSCKKVGRVTFIPNYEGFLDKARVLNWKTTFPNMSVENFQDSAVGYVVLPDQAELARKYYVGPVEKKEKKKLCNR